MCAPAIPIAGAGAPRSVAVRWRLSGRYLGLHHKNGALEEWKRGQSRGALQAWKRRRYEVRSSDAVVVRVVAVEPIFTVSDVARAVEHYQRLGFKTSYDDEGYAFAHRDDLTIHLAGADPQAAGGGSIYMHVDDADSLADDWRRAGVEVVDPKDFDYRKREGSHTDLDGNLIRFGSPLSPSV